ncbi:ATP-binding protein [Catenulispora rubra]|uniref:ATP-binding protein n=1 Tax=Catenulispora rubra TaxID=280293 RepID=UPI0018921D2F|nr:ATP-binding protein [Catenulispora rubra]
MDVWSKQFAGRLECLVEAWRFAVAVLGDGDGDGARTVALVADKAAGNAIKHTVSGETGGELVLWLARFGNRCQVRVDDQGAPTAPAVYPAEDLDDAGRGLTIADTLSSTWGVDGDEHTLGLGRSRLGSGRIRTGSGDTRVQRSGHEPAPASEGEKTVGTTTGDWAR